MDTKDKRPARRAFLLGAGTAGAAGVAAVAAVAIGGQPGAVTDLPKPQLDAKGGGGYHVSDHVRNYYRTTGI